MTCEIKTKPLSKEEKSIICGVITLGCDRETAANRVNCSLADIRRAMDDDANFMADIRRAEAAVEIKHMNVVNKVTDDIKNWRASVWWLERHAPERFGPRGAGEITVRQLKAFTALFFDIVASVEDAKVRQTLFARLAGLNDSVEQLIRDERATNDIANSLTRQLWNEPDSNDADGDDNPNSESSFDSLSSR